MHYKIINPKNIQIEHSYSAEQKQIFGGEWGKLPHIPVPPEMDPDIVSIDSITSEEVIIIDTPEVINSETGEVITPAITHKEIQYTVVFYEDNGKRYDKIQAQKQAQIDAINNNTWATILTEAKTVYELSSIDDRNEASILILATHSTYESMVNNPAAYVGDLFPNEAAVLGYAQPKLAASLAFGKWRMGILAAEKAQKDAILNS